MEKDDDGSSSSNNNNNNDSFFGSDDFRLFEDDNMDIDAFVIDPDFSWSPGSYSLDELDKTPDSNNNNNNSSSSPSAVDTSGWEAPLAPPSNVDPTDYTLDLDPYLTNYDSFNDEFRFDPTSPGNLPFSPFDGSSSSDNNDVLLSDLLTPLPPPPPLPSPQQHQLDAVAQEKSKAHASKAVSLAPPQWLNMLHPETIRQEEDADGRNVVDFTGKKPFKQITFKDETPTHLRTALTTTTTATAPASPQKLQKSVLKRKRADSQGPATQVADRVQQHRQPSTPLMTLKHAMEMLQLEVLGRTVAERQLSKHLARASTLDHYRAAVQEFVAGAQFVSEGVRTAFEGRLQDTASINPAIWVVVGTLLANAHGDYGSFMALSASSTTFYNFFNSDAVWLFLLGRELYWDNNRVSDSAREIAVKTYIMHHSAFLRVAGGPYLYDRPLEVWRAAKRLVELRWRVRKAIMSKSTEANARKRIGRVYALNGTIMSAVPTMVCMPESPWLFAVSANGVAMWQAGIRDLFVKVRFSKAFLGADQTISAPLRCRPVLEATPSGATLLVGNFAVSNASIVQWWTHMRNLARETGTLRFFEAIVGTFGGAATTKKVPNLHAFHTAAGLLPTIQMGRTYEARFASMKETTHVLGAPLPAQLKQMMDAEERRLVMVYLYDRAILDLCVRAAHDPRWFGPGAEKYLWGTTDHTRLDPYAHQHIACSTGGGVVATVTPSLLMVAELNSVEVAVSSVQLSPLTDVLATVPSITVKRQRAWPLFVILKRVFALTIDEPNIVLVGVTFASDFTTTTNESLLTITVRAPMADADACWLLSLTLSPHLLLESSTSLDIAIASARSSSNVISDDRLGIVKDRRYSSTRGFAVVPERPDTAAAPNTMGLKMLTVDPPVDTLAHLIYSPIPSDIATGSGATKWHIIPRLSARGIMTPPSPPSFASTIVRNIDGGMASDPRYRAAVRLRALLQARRLHKNDVVPSTIFGAIGDLWTARDAVNWRMRCVVIEFGIMSIYFIEGRHLRVIGVPWSTAGSIHNYRIPLWSKHVDLRHYDRMAITCVHQGVVIVELLRRVVGSDGNERLVWSAVVVRLTSFHPVNLFPSSPDKAATIPNVPLVSRRITSDSKSVLPYGQPAEHEDMMALWTGL